MRHPVAVPVLLAPAALAGYAAGARPVEAQSQGLPFSIGEIVAFRYADNGSRDCRIDATPKKVNPHPEDSLCRGDRGCPQAAR